MKKISAVIALLLFISINNYSQEKEPARPDNVPSYVRWDKNGWEIYDRTTILSNTVRWYPDGKIWGLNYLTDDEKIEITRYFYNNGNKKSVRNKINYDYYKYKYYNKKSINIGDSRLYLGKFQEYYENGKLKVDKYYRLAMEEVTVKEVKVRTELCGDETYYDEKGNVTKKISHGGECPEYNFPELSVEEVIEKMRTANFEDRFGDMPEIGKVTKKGDKEIKIKYKSGFELKQGDYIIWIYKRRVLYFECERNEKDTGYFKLVSEDKSGRYKELKEGDSVNFTQGTYFVDQKEIERKNRSKGDEMTVGDIEFAYVPGGEKVVEVEGVKTRIKVKSFWISKYEMTEGAYQKYYCELFRYTFHEVKQADFASRYPVNLGGNSTSTTQYLSWFTGKYKVNARLAQPNEWIYAASGGTEWQKNMKADMKKYAWYSENSGGEVRKVGEKEANDYGLYDMNGNAWEWVSGSHLIGGSYKSGLSEMTGFKSVFASYDYWADVSRGTNQKAPWSNLTETCTSFRVVIEAE